MMQKISCIKCKYCYSEKPDASKEIFCLNFNKKVNMNKYLNCDEFEIFEGFKNSWENCKFKENNCCGFINNKKCNATCDLKNLKFDKDVIIKKCLSELEYIQTVWSKYQNEISTKNSIYGFLLLSGLLLVKFEYNIKKVLTIKQKIFIARNNLFKKL